MGFSHFFKFFLCFGANWIYLLLTFLDLGWLLNVMFQGQFNSWRLKMFWFGISVGFFDLIVFKGFFIKVCNGLNFLDIFVLNLFFPFLLIMIEVLMMHFRIILLRSNFLHVWKHRLSVFFFYFFASFVELMGKTIPNTIMNFLLRLLLHRFFPQNFLFFNVLLFYF